MGRDAESRVITPSDDGLAIPEVGPWAKRKYHYLGRYLNGFTKAMREKWRELHYLDLFAGAGFARIKGSDELVITSSLLAAGVEFPFTKLHVCDRDAGNTHALSHRLSQVPGVQSRIITGDANSLIADIVGEIPRRNTLAVTFADPFGLHLDFDTVRKIAEVRSDLVILLADNMDALRNWATYYLNNPQSNLDRFMGESGWRDLLSQAPSDKQAEVLRTRYKERLQELGYKEFAHERIVNATGRDIYILLYASRDKAGLKIWHGISRIEESGQRRLF